MTNVRVREDWRMDELRYPTTISIAFVTSFQFIGHVGLASSTCTRFAMAYPIGINDSAQ